MTNKLKYFIGNWKMFGDFGSIKIIYQIHQFCLRFKKQHKKNKIVLCVPNTLISFFTKKLKSTFLSIGAQNCHYYQNYGPFTGSLNAKMLKGAGAEYIILGHSENRLEGENDKLIKKKIISSLERKLNIILCIGETLSEKKNNKTFSVLKKQLNNSLIRKFKINKIIIAYEPVWCIGSNKIPNIKELTKTIYFIKKEIKKILRITKSPKVLYGGSVNEKNIRLFSLISEIDGFLIGGASQSAKKFIDIVKNYYK